MNPVVVLVGRPNVGKSSLFNALTKTRDALVYDVPGVTRDRIYGEIQVDSKPFILIDTGGIDEGETGVYDEMATQTQAAVEEADIILMMVDAKDGITAPDQMIANTLRKHSKPVILCVNKMDALPDKQLIHEFHGLGLGEPLGISAAHRSGLASIHQAIAQAHANLPEPEAIEAPPVQPDSIKLCFVGRPNVGKSTLINRMLGTERVVVYDQPGTTRDSVYIPFERRGQHYTLIDTAGVRRKGRVDKALEKFSIVKTLRAIEDAHVVVIVIDAQEGVTEQDLHLIGFTLQQGRAIVITVNKWDGLSTDDREAVKQALDRRLRFIQFARIRTISALHGTGVGDLFADVAEAYKSATIEMQTSDLTARLEQAVRKHAPPTGKTGNRIKLRFAHPGGCNPPVVVIHGRMTKQLPDSYKRYLESFFQKSYKLVGTPVKIVLKDGDNPYVDQ